jgi:hypothetical protein
MPTATHSKRHLMVGAWEGKRGCLTTSLVGAHRNRLVEVFDTLQFRERSKGLVIDSPVTPRPREPEVIKEIPRLGILEIKPAIPSTLDRVPRSSGFATGAGELFRFRETSTTLLFVGNSAVVRIDPLTKGGSQETGAQQMAAKKGARRKVGQSDRGQEDQVDLEQEEEENDTQDMLAIAQSLSVEWVPRG